MPRHAFFTASPLGKAETNTWRVVVARIRQVTAFLAVLIAIFLVAAPGCQSKANKAVHPVRGQVVYKGNPIKDCRVILYPLTDTEDIERPEGYTDDQGYFEVTARRNEKGAAEGEYAVVLIWQDRNDDPDAEVSFKGANKLPEKYSRPSTTDLRVKVVPGQNNIEPFVIP